MRSWFCGHCQKRFVTRGVALRHLRQVKLSGEFHKYMTWLKVD